MTCCDGIDAIYVNILQFYIMFFTYDISLLVTKDT